MVHDGPEDHIPCGITTNLTLEGGCAAPHPAQGLSDSHKLSRLHGERDNYYVTLGI